MMNIFIASISILLGINVLGGVSRMEKSFHSEDKGMHRYVLCVCMMLYVSVNTLPTTNATRNTAMHLHLITNKCNDS